VRPALDPDIEARLERRVATLPTLDSSQIESYQIARLEEGDFVSATISPSG